MAAVAILENRKIAIP